MNLGQYIRNSRIDKKMSLKQLAKKVNCSITIIHNIESGKQKHPKSVILFRISRVLELDYNKLLDYKFADYYKKEKYRKIKRMMRDARV